MMDGIYFVCFSKAAILQHTGEFWDYKIHNNVTDRIFFPICFSKAAVLQHLGAFSWNYQVHDGQDLKKLCWFFPRLLFYSTWGSSPGIMKCLMNGTGCSVLVYQRIRQPDHLLTFDDRLYWSNAALGHISSILYNGTDRIKHVQ